MNSSIGHSKHAHRWTLRTGPQVISTVDPGGSEHVHSVQGTISGPPITYGDDHTHMLQENHILIESGPSISKEQAKKDMDTHGTTVAIGSLSKAIMPDMVDPEHLYVFKTGDYGLYNFWYIDGGHNYWKYSNAPEDDPDFDPNLGVPVMSKEQPLPADNPQFFTYEGKKRHMAVPPGILADRNEEYNLIDPFNIWFEVYEREGERRYIYLDSDIRENIDLWVQYQLRIADANIPTMRKFATDKFNADHPKDKLVGAIIMLMDQGLYELEEILNATVSNLEFIDNTVKFLGRKFISDPEFLDFLTSLVGDRDPASPLFILTSLQGEGKLGTRHIASIFKYLKVPPAYLLAWHASHVYSRILNRLAFEGKETEDIDGLALSELKRVFGTQKDLQYLVDCKLRNLLLDNYDVSKSIVPRVEADDYGVLTVFSDLLGRRGDEVEFSTWLHSQPMHEITPEEQEEVSSAVERATEEAEAEEQEEVVDSEGNVQESDAADQEAGAVDTDFGKEQA